MAIASAPCLGLNPVGPIFPKAPAYAHYPISFRDLLAVVLLATLIQRVLWFGLSVLACGIAFWFGLLAPDVVPLFLAKLAFFMLLSCPVAVMSVLTKFDFMLRGFWKQVLVLVLVIAVLAGYVGLVLLPNFRLLLCAAAFTAAITAIAVAIYWRWHVTTRIDLIFRQRS